MTSQPIPHSSKLDSDTNLDVGSNARDLESDFKSSKNLIQMITESEHFNSEELSNYLSPLLYEDDVKFTESSDSTLASFKRPPLNRRNSKRDTLSYHTISIFGPQSSGKSTLLNNLFETNFDIMSSEEYSQCTLGIFLSITDIMNQKVFVLDVEGTDSPERQQHGDEGQSFEKRVSLFALAVSEVLLVNLWAKDVNRYQASNYSLLKTVFEMNLQLFYQESNQNKTMLLFILRDYDGHIGKDKMSKQVENHVEKIWESCSKPKGKEKVTVNDLFDVKIEFLPHKVYEPERFKTEVGDMKKRIFDPASDEYIFQEKYHKQVPLAGFEVYTENIWKQILENKDLNIPAQKEILARFRCAEISEEIIHEFTIRQNEWNKESKIKIIENFGRIAKVLVDELIARFEDQASLYVPSIVQDSATELRNRMIMGLYSIFINLVTLSRRAHEERFRDSLQKLIDEAPEKLISNFYQVAQNAQDKTIAVFKQDISDLSYPESDWDTQNIIDDLNAKVSQIIGDEREKQLKVQLQKQKEKVGSALEKQLQSNRKTGLLFEPKETFWSELRDVMADITHENKDILLSILKDYRCSKTEKETFISEIESYLKQHAKKYVAEYVKYIPSHMMKVFSTRFPPSNITGKSVQQLMELFKLAREEGLAQLDLFFMFREDESLDDIKIIFPDYEEGKPSRSQLEYTSSPPSELLLITEDDVKNYFIDFSHEIEIKLVNAKHEQQRSGMTSIPWWIYLALLILGWNEIMYVLRNPLLMFLIFAGIVIITWIKFRDGVDQFLSGIENPTIKLALQLLSTYLPAGVVNVQNKETVDSKESSKKEN